MATFKERIEDLAGTISDGIDAEQFMKDGIYDTVSRMKVVNPELLDLFGKNGNYIGDSNGFEIKTEFLWATRNDRLCSVISPAKKDLAGDENSIYSATSNYPVIYQIGNKVYILPAPTIEEPGVVRYINYGTITNFSSGTSAISDFPSNMEHIPIIYSAMKVVGAKVNDFSFTAMDSLPDIPEEPLLDSISTSTLPDFTAPDAPEMPTLLSDADVSFTNLPDMPSFTKPVLSLPSIPTISDLSLSSNSPTVPDAPNIISSGIATTTISFETNPPAFDNTAITSSIGEMNDFIDSDEDVELAAAKGQEVQIILQNALNEFNEKVAEYNAQLQVSLEQARIAMSEAEKEGAMALEADIKEYEFTLSKFQLAVQKYQADVNAEITEYSANLKKDIDLYNSEVQAVLGQYSNDIQNESANINSEIENYKTSITKSIQTYTSETGYDLSKYSAQVSAVLNEYQALLASATTSFQQEVESYRLENAKVSARNNERINKYQVDSVVYQSNIQKVIQEYTATIQKESIEITNLSNSYLRLKQEYEEAFIPFRQQKTSG